MGVISKNVSKKGITSYQAKCRRQGFPTVSKTFKTLADARAFVREVERGFDLGEVPEGFGVQPQAPATDPAAQALNLKTMADILRKYREDVSPKHRAADNERIRIGAWLRGGLPFRDTDIAALTPAMLATYRDARLKVVSAGTVLRELNLLRAALNVAKLEWGVPVPDLKITRPKAPPPRERVLGREEEARLLAAASKSRNKYLRPAIAFALATACRQGEILALRWTDVDEERRVARLHITKNGDPRSVPLSAQALEVLRALPRDTRDGRVFSVYELKQAFARCVKRAELEHITFHDLRHTALTRYAERGLDQIRLSVISGHKTIQMLKRYVHLKAEDVAELMD